MQADVHSINADNVWEIQTFLIGLARRMEIKTVSEKVSKKMQILTIQTSYLYRLRTKKPKKQQVGLFWLQKYYVYMNITSSDFWL